MRTDMKAKIFEWVDSGFQVPGKLLRDQDAGYWITKGLGFSRTCAATIGGVFKLHSVVTPNPMIVIAS